MASLSIYLLFDGNCEAAFNHYKKVFCRDFVSLLRYGDVPAREGMPELSEGERSKIENISLPISEKAYMMGADGLESLGMKPVIGNNFSIYFEADEKEQADHIFKGLSENGIAKMPMTLAHWGDYFGMCTDMFGVNWFINCSLKENLG